jgi:endo-1,4-beta-mannosidase
MQLIAMSPDGRGFVERESKRSYVPFGTNYYDPHTGWAPKIWPQFDAEKVRRHFEVMSELGVNCARVFLAAVSFQPDVETIDEEFLKKLDTLVKIARESGIRLMLTGPDHWEGAPSYWKPDRFAGENALRALERFWKVVGRRYRGEPAIFAWDLLNEPHLPWFVEGWRPLWNTWLQKKYGSWGALKAGWGDELTDTDKWGGIGVPGNRPDAGNPRLRDWQLFREHLGDEWVARQVEALRRADPTALVTVGYVQWSYPLVRPGNPGRYTAFNPRRQGHLLDFVTIHFYPLLGALFGSDEAWGKNLAYLQAVLAYCHVGKPVVLAEFGWYGGGAPQKYPYLSEAQQARWIGAEIEASRPLAAGWLSWPFADTPTSRDISLFSGLVKEDLTIKQWGRKFKALAPNLSELKQPTLALPEFDYPEAFTAGAEELDRMHQAYAEGIRRAIVKMVQAQTF